jgi:hypothetical protein
MAIPALIAILAGVICIGIYLANLFGKRKARGEPLVRARVADSTQSEWRSTGGEGPATTSYIVKTSFEVPGRDNLTQTRHFSTQIDANAWAARFTSGSWHAVAPHPYVPGEVFLEEDLAVNSPAALIFGMLVLAGGAAAFYFG